MIAYQGHEGAYSHLACRKVFPERETYACNSFLAAMESVETGVSELAMIPVENSTAGRVEEIYRLIPKMQLHIVAEHFETVHHCLMAPHGVEKKQIREVLSHPQALAQCSQSIRDLRLSPRATLDTAGAALTVSESDRTDQAAIASRLAAELYNLQILEEDFQDEAGNTTRFIILSKEDSVLPVRSETRYLTSLLFKVRNIPAALYKALGGFATNGVNLIKLESYMPDGSMNASQFHADIEGHLQSEAMQHALDELNFFADDVRWLGTYEAHPYREKLQMSANSVEEASEL